MLALSDNGSVYFWGKHFSETMTTKPKIVCRNLGTVEDIAATRGCPISVCKTETMVYFWGRWHEQLITKPMPAGHGSMSQVFAFADQPVMHREIVLPDTAVALPMMTKLEANFGDVVSHFNRLNCNIRKVLADSVSIFLIFDR